MPTSTPTGTQTAPVTFIAKSRDLRVVVIPETRTTDLRGMTTRHPGKRIEFGTGTPPGTFLADDKAAKNLGFDDLAELLAWLRDHVNFNVEFNEIGNEPDRIPPAAPRIKEIVQAWQAGDNDAVQNWYDEETSGFNRPEVMATFDGLMEPGED